MCNPNANANVYKRSARLGAGTTPAAAERLAGTDRFGTERNGKEGTAERYETKRNEKETGIRKRVLGTARVASALLTAATAAAAAAAAEVIAGREH